MMADASFVYWVLYIQVRTKKLNKKLHGLTLRFFLSAASIVRVHSQHACSPSIIAFNKEASRTVARKMMPRFSNTPPAFLIRK